MTPQFELPGANFTHWQSGSLHHRKEAHHQVGGRTLPSSKGPSRVLFSAVTTETLDYTTKAPLPNTQSSPNADYYKSAARDNAHIEKGTIMHHARELRVYKSVQGYFILTIPSLLSSRAAH